MYACLKRDLEHDLNTIVYAMYFNLLRRVHAKYIQLARELILYSFHIRRRLLMCRVTLGKPVEQYNAIKIAHAPPGHHSVIGRPSTGGLHYPEYAIYRGEQVRVTGFDPTPVLLRWVYLCPICRLIMSLLSPSAS